MHDALSSSRHKARVLNGAHVVLNILPFVTSNIVIVFAPFVKCIIVIMFVPFSKNNIVIMFVNTVCKE